MHTVGLIVVSPHLDDAVFSCGTLIAAAAHIEEVLVVTVFAGSPKPDVLTSLDELAGFTSSAEAMQTRRREDRRAVRGLGAYCWHMGLLDGAYDQRPRAERAEAVTRALGEIIDFYRLNAPGCRFLTPLGIRHDDHKLVAEAVERLGVNSDIYEELPYRVLWPEQVPKIRDPDFTVAVSSEKLAAICCYRSQLGDGPPGIELSAEERYHQRESL